MIVLAEFLVTRGFVSAAVMAEAQAARALSRVPLGQVAMRANLLTFKQVFDVLAHQTKTRQMFGQAAVALRLLTTREVDSLLRQQYATMTPLEDVLVEMEAMLADDMTAALGDFHRLTPPSLPSLPRTPPRPSGRPHVA